MKLTPTEKRFLLRVLGREIEAALTNSPMWGYQAKPNQVAMAERLAEAGYVEIADVEEPFGKRHVFGEPVTFPNIVTLTHKGRMEAGK